MFGFKKRKTKVKANENLWRLQNEIYRKINEVEHLFKRLDEIKDKGKKEKNPNLQQLIANEYLMVENKIKMQSIALKEMQKTLIQGQDFANKDGLLADYAMVDSLSTSNVSDLRKMVVKIKDIQVNRLKDDKERDDINEVFNESIDLYSTNLQTDQAKSLTELWARENEEEQLIDDENKVNLFENTISENKEDN